ncbi:MAG: hypothetical protein NTX15_01335 [Candidatus Kapabacteria bacterium]|nr:hypothetical protein [Candidatus Kapabacteria bacterium]
MDPEMNIDPLAPLRNDSATFSLADSLVRASDIRTREALLRRLVYVSLGFLSTAILAWWFLSNSSVVSPMTKSVSASVETKAVGPIAPLMTTPIARTRDAHIDVAIKKVTFRSLLDDVAESSPATLNSLDVDLQAYAEIRSMLGTSDRVVSVDNNANRETCLQITCEGGDSRSIVCSAPAPSPICVTRSNGELVFAIERSNSDVARWPLVAVRARIKNEDVLLWYEQAPALLAKLRGSNLTSPEVSGQYLVLRRPNGSIVVEHHGARELWETSTLYRMDGTLATGSKVAWHQEQRAAVLISVSDVLPGAYELRSTCYNGEAERILLMVR